MTAKSPTEEFKFTCKHLAMTTQNVPLEYLTSREGAKPKYIARCILITNKSILQSEESDKNDVT